MAYDPIKTRRVTFDMTPEMYQRLEALQVVMEKAHISEVMRELVDKNAPKLKKIKK